MLRLASIIIVHGLGGNPHKTWASKASKNLPSNPRNLRGHSPPKLLVRIRTKFSFLRNSDCEEKPAQAALSTEDLHWPRDLLPRDCSTARILVWGYDSHITKGYSSSNKGNIFAHSKDLLYSLRRDKPPRRPIIFVAHSLGGLIVKEVS